MYEAFFHLHGTPFPAPPTVTNYFPAQAIESARQSLLRIVERAEGPGFVVGPAGVGKSLLLRMLAEHFSETYRVALLSGTRVATRKSLLQSIHFELGLPYRGLDEGELRLGLIDALRPSQQCPNGILLLLDEAHTLPLRLLDELRMITNVVRDGQPRARLVLAGGPLLEERFTSPKIESFSQRIAARCYLHALTRDETHQFVRAQISWAGGDPDAIFTDDAIRAICQASDGIPRLINQICDHALLLAHANGTAKLNAEQIQEAWADLQQLPPPWQEPAVPSAMSSNTVIEFGELDSYDLDVSESDKYELDEADVDPAPVSEAEFDFSAPTQLLDSHLPDEGAIASVPMAELHSSALIGLPTEQYEVEWFSGEFLSEPTVSPPLAADPFESTFDEEVVVIDRSKATEVEAFRNRPRVSCMESRQLLAELRSSSVFPERRMSDDDCRQVIEKLTVTAPLSEFPAPAFEFTTFQCMESVDLPEPMMDSAQDTVGKVLDQLEHDLDEEIDSVPMPWSRSTRNDDRDVIIIEDDMPSVTVFADVEEEDGKAPRRMEYRELFAQLRRTST